jgi:glycosyltransferase involved in cell wall biosynthesis
MSAHSFENQASEVDIALILESSYPFILGGVSSWVHRIIENFPQFSFALIFLGGAPENYKEGIRYPIPNNVLHFQVHYLFDEDEPPPPTKNVKGNEEEFGILKKMHDSFKCPSAEKLQKIGDISKILNDPSGVSYEQFLYSKLSWDYIKEEYTKQCEDSSFIDYFWTVKNIHKPLWKLASILNHFPKAKVVHTVSTGYAGLLGFFIHQHYKYPLVLTEHGIYTKERKIDVFLNQVFRDDPDRALTETSYLRNLWDRYFKTLAQLTYTVADPIVSLFKHAHQIQLEEGADEQKTLIIPNGIDIERFRRLRRPVEEKLPIICFVGRIVPMKDVKGFIRVVPNLRNVMPNLQVWIIGSTDQDPKYAEECIELIENTLQQDVIKFMPHQKMEDILPQVKVLVLPAIREGMPLIVLESFAAGVPVVATDVGACKEMVMGLEDDDVALGPAGKIVKVADAKELEHAILEILQDNKLWTQMSKSAIKRVEKLYDERTMVEKYLQIYKGIMDKG